MTKAIPAIRKYMTTSPLSIGSDKSLLEAHAMMREHEIRHLPVLDNGVLVGVVSARDISQLEALVGGNPRAVPVSDAMSRSAYHVSPSAPLDEVASEMAKHKLGSVVVMDHHHVVGIVTTVDVCNALVDLLHGRLAN